MTLRRGQVDGSDKHGVWSSLQGTHRFLGVIGLLGSVEIAVGSEFDISPFNLQGRWPETRRRLNSSELYDGLRHANSILSKEFVDRALKAIHVDTLIESALGVHDTLLKLAKVGEPESRILTKDLLQVEDFVGRFVTQASGGPTEPFVFTEERLDPVYALQVINKLLGTLKNFATDLRRLCQNLAEQSNVAVPFFRGDDLYECSCGDFNTGKVRPCQSCGADLSDIQPLSLPRLDTAFRIVVENNFWAELGAAKILKDKGLETFVGAEVRGVSGQWHEVDILAVDREAKLIFLFEVVSGAGNLAELAPVLVRNLDIQPTLAALVSIQRSPSSVIEFGLKHKVWVIDDLRSNPQLLEKWVEHVRGIFARPRPE
jgi:hypothetical protein